MLAPRLQSLPPADYAAPWASVTQEILAAAPAVPASSCSQQGYDIAVAKGQAMPEVAW